MNKFGLEKNKFGYFTATPLPSKLELAEFYEHKYYQQQKGNYQKCYSELDLTFFEQESKVANYILEKFIINKNRPSKNLLDVGIGEGFFAKFFNQDGWSVISCDYSSHGLQNQNPELLEGFIQGDISDTLSKLSQARNKFGLINLKNVLEHVIDPEEILGLVKPLVHEGGLLRIVVPNDYSDFQNRLAENELSQENWLCPPEHLHYFQLESLSALLAGKGLKIYKILSDFPIEIFNANLNSNYYLDSSKGKDAHLARIEIDNFIALHGIDKYIEFYESAAKVGLGRQLIVFVTA